MPESKSRTFLGLALFTATLGVLVAAPLSSARAASADLDNKVALSMSPIHLLLPFVELQAEIYATDVISVSLIGGVGSVTVTSGREDHKFTVWEGGAQLRAYFVGDVQEGAFAGAEALYVAVDGRLEGHSAIGDGLAVGPIAGYKWTWGSGFFIDLNGGISYGFLRAEASGDKAEDSQIIPIVNFNLGFAF